MNAKPVEHEILNGPAPGRGEGLTACTELLHLPEQAAKRLEGPGWAGAASSVAAFALGCAVLYGAAAGSFQGGVQVALAAFKAPLILFGALLLCVPSFYVFTALSGAPLPGRQLAGILCGLSGLIGWILVGLLPINWLFSVSSRSLPFVVVLHLAVWGVALGFAWRYFARVVPERARQVAGWWLVLLCIVALQVSTSLRPVLWRADGAPWIAREKLSFLEHFGELTEDPKPRSKG